MDADRFINRPMSTCLDAVRYASALLVLVGHSWQQKLYVGAYPFTARLQHNCVIVFFVLSGLVIAHSIDNRNTNLARYAIARTARLMPVALCALAYGSLVYLAARHIGVSIDHPPRSNRFDAVALLSPVFFLSETLFTYGPVWNPPYWSLCYEAWFYALFGFGVYLRSWTRAGALLVATLLAGPNVLLLFPVWLCGVLLTRLTLAKVHSPAIGCSLMLAGLLIVREFGPFDIFLKLQLQKIVPWNVDYAGQALSDIPIGIGVALAFVGLRPLAMLCANQLRRIEPKVQWLAGSAFTLYLFHWPILSLLKLFGITELHSFWAWLAVLAGIVLATLGIAELTERRTPEVRRWLEARLLSPRAPAPQSA